MKLSKYQQQYTISNPWCQKVLDLLDLTFAELFVILWMELQGTLRNSDSQWIIKITKDSPHTLMVILIKVTFSSKQRRKISGIFKIFPPSQGTQAKVPKPCYLKRQRKFELFNPSQAKLEKWLEEQHRQGAAVQPYPVIT